MREILEKIKKCSKVINDEEFEEIFSNALKKVKRKFTKLETKQYYQCDMDENYHSFLNGKYEKLSNVFLVFYKEWPSIIEKKKKNIEFRRLHLVTEPITDYIKYEMYFYLIGSKSGEKIKILDYEKANINPSEIDDFIIFDENELIINHHNKNGEYLKSYYNCNKSLIKELLKEFDKLYSKSKDFKEVSIFNERIIKQMKDSNII